MGEDPRQGSPAVGDAGSRDPEEIRRDIEVTREELGGTVEALSAKADVKAQAKEKVEDWGAQAKERLESVRESVTGKKDPSSAPGSTVSPESFDAGRAVATAKENPIPLAIGALTLGFALGRLTAR